jgi:hypothetical protein
MTDVSKERVLIYQPGSTLFEDDFTGTDTTAISARTANPAVNGSSWVDDGTEELVIASDKMVSSGVTGITNNYVYANLQNQDYTINTTFKSNSGGFFAKLDIIIRYIDKQNYIALTMDSKIGAPNMSITKVVGGVSSELQEIQAASGTTYKDLEATVAIVANNTSITVTGSWANGTAISGSTTSSLMANATKVGIHCDTTLMTINDFKVTKT